VSARERPAASVADDTGDCRDAWPAWCEDSGGLVVRESARQDVCCVGTTPRRGARRRRGHWGQAGVLAQSVQRPLWLSCPRDSGYARRCVRVVWDGTPPKPALTFSYAQRLRLSRF